MSNENGINRAMLALYVAAGLLALSVVMTLIKLSGVIDVSWDVVITPAALVFGCVGAALIDAFWRGK